MDKCFELCLCGWPAVLRGKSFSVGQYRQAVQPNFFLPAMLIGTIDFKHFVLLSLTLTLPGGLKVSAMQNLLASFSHTLLI